MRPGHALFWAPTVTLAWVYLGYPAAAALAAWLRPFRLRPSQPLPPLVTVGITVHNEEQDLEARVEDILAQEVGFELEILIASDGSTDRTNEIAAALERRDRRIRLLALPRAGATAAQSAIFREARGTVVTLTDVETRYAPGCLQRLVEPLRDPRVGAVTGRLLWANENESAVSRQEGAYWRYEQMVRALESRAGWLATMTGALAAVRREVVTHLPDVAAGDLLIPLLVRDHGLVVLVEPTALASDRGVVEVHQQFASRARIATHGIRAALMMSGRLTPWRRPSAFLAVWSHKLLRWATPLLAVTSGTGALLLVAEGDRLYAVPIGAGVGLIGLAGAGWVLERRGVHHRATAFPLAIVVVNAGFLAGWVNLALGRNVHGWHRSKVEVR